MYESSSSFAEVGVKTVLKIAGGVVLAATPHTVLSNFGIGPFETAFPQSMQIIQAIDGCICFMVETSHVSSLRELWKSYIDGSLKKKLEDVFNGIPEVMELSNGEQIHVEVIIDQEEYQNALWNLVISQVQGENL